jgi:hypothetical protein
MEGSDSESNDTFYNEIGTLNNALSNKKLLKKELIF